MNIVVLGSPASWYAADIRRAAGGRHEVRVVDHRALRARVGDEDTRAAAPVATHDADAILIRSMPPGSLEQVVFRMDVLGRLAAAGKVVVNPPRAVEAAVDKYLAIAKCREAGLTIPDTAVCQSADDALSAFSQLEEDVVVKPLFGGEGRGLFRVTDRDAAGRAFRMLDQLNAIIYLQRFVPHDGFDLRLFVVGKRVLGMQRHNALDWRSNVSRGATAKPLQLDDRLVDMARRATAAVGGEVVGVDVLPGRDGELYLLEVNAVPGWRALAKTLNEDVAALVLQHVEDLFDGRK